MKIRLISLILLLATGVGLSMFWFKANGAGLERVTASVICMYSHRLPDDPIVYPAQPGIAMQHDFFGHTTTTADTRTEDLYTEHSSTCENSADNTAYWAPTLKLADGTIVAPEYQKTYYHNWAFPAVHARLTTPLPPGIQMLAGDHKGTAPSSVINFLCTGSTVGYTHSIPTDCVPDPVKGTQFNIAVAFPNCWDGTNLKPTRGGPNNVAYANDDGVCPAAYPVPLPHLSFNIAYMVGHVRDMTGTELSMDPTLDEKGNVVQQNWGTLYTAHADFFNGWTEGALRYMVEYCLNKGRSCGREVAYSYSEVSADAAVRGGDTANDNFGSAKEMLAQRATELLPESKIYMKVDIPKGVENIPPEFTPSYRLLLWGGAVDTTAIIRAYTTANHWHEDTITYDNAPSCSDPNGSLYLDSAQQYRYFDVTALVKAAIAAGETSLSFCIRGDVNGHAYKFESREGGTNMPILYLYAVNPLNF